MEISETKLKFLNHVGIDLENLPKEFAKVNKSYAFELTKEEKDFLYSSVYTQAFILPFCLKDIVGTSHPTYEDLTFLESFIKSKRGDENVRMFYQNPSYYSETLKQKNQSPNYATHDTPIELNRDSDGKCYIMGGNNRIYLIMMTYLKELSEANTDEEKELINQKYTFYAEVKSLPKNKDIVSMIFLLREYYEDNIKFVFKGENPDDCHYVVMINEQEIEIKNDEELKGLLLETYKLSGENKFELYKKLVYITTIYIQAKAQNNIAKIKLLENIYPNLEVIKDLFLAIRRLNNSSAIFDEIDTDYLSNSNIVDFLKTVYERELNKKDNITR
ncbi:MAG: hypothetical protein IJN03_01445 [Bacilli bacterium]|nr:hypothetical protein [Bacilli bacterium]